jgi:hypothetical protein
MRVTYSTLLIVLLLCQKNEAFQNSVGQGQVRQQLPSNKQHSDDSARKVDTSLYAVPPTYIIGPMIRKMREEREKKKMPMAAPDEAALEAPGLRVGKNAWKWPPVWPYDATSFVPKNEEVPPPKPDLAAVASMVSGDPQMPIPAPVPQVTKLDPIKYWGEDRAEVLTELSEGAIANLKK